MPRSDESERRLGARADVALELYLARKVGRPICTRTMDLGPGGARVRSDRPLRVDEELRFDIDLPSGSAHLGGTARVLRQDRHDLYALRFEHVEPATLAELRGFVDASNAPLPS